MRRADDAKRNPPRNWPCSAVRPLLRKPCTVGRPNIPNRERLFERLTAILDRRILTNNGPCVQEFEEKLAEMLGVRHCVAVCNATIALQLAVRALRLSGEVILPSFTFVATVHALAWEGATPVFCDVDRDTHTIDPRQVESLITERTVGDPRRAHLGASLRHPRADETRRRPQALAFLRRRPRRRLLLPGKDARRLRQTRSAQLPRDEGPELLRGRGL